MHLTIVASGRWKRGAGRALFALYQERLRWPLILREIDAPGGGGSAPIVRRREEARRLAAAIPTDARRVILDARGRMLDSDAFAQCFASWRSDGAGNIAFVIGGADGLDPSFLDTAHLVLSFGAMTWPHLLIRVMLIEQIYRAQQILAGHPYHHATES